MLNEKYFSDEEWKDLMEQIDKGNIRVSNHPEYPLSIYNYTTQCESEEDWNKTTLRCRGLVLDTDSNEVIIEPIPKFFNYDTKYAEAINIADPATEITLKEDGFLIQFRFHPVYGLIVTSKGSFVSEMALDAKQFLESNGIEKERDLLPFTYICEWCKDYDDCAGYIVTKHPQERLVCFAIRDINGREYSPDSLYIPPYIEKVKKFTPDEAEKYLDGQVEGVVLKNRNKRVKVKTQWFLEVHRAISHCTKKTVWETLVRGERVEDLNNIPDEFLTKMLTWQKELIEAFEKEKNWAEEWEETIFEVQGMNEKGLALNTSLGFTSYQKGLIFDVHRDKIVKMYDSIWKKLKPKGGE